MTNNSLRDVDLGRRQGLRTWYASSKMISLRCRYTKSLPAGNRWHIDCFRCNSCGTLLDSDANLLLLGDGSLICNNCTYSCSACGNKIEDLAILTGDQAFCATCFRCRNCKKKIENLKYARTSQGIFCMECHESLMQRRRKKTQKHGTSRHKHREQPSNNNTMLLDKSLPKLPPSAVDRTAALSPDAESLPSDGTSDTPTGLPRISQKPPGNSRSSSYSSPAPDLIPRSAHKRPANSRSSSSRSTKRERSPPALGDDHKGIIRCTANVFNCLTYNLQRTLPFLQAHTRTTGIPQSHSNPTCRAMAKTPTSQWRLI